MSGVPGSIASIRSAPSCSSERDHGGGVNGVPGVERGSLERQSRPVGAGLEHSAPPVSHPATEDGRHAPTRDRGAELELPPLGKSGQRARQLVEPRLHFAAEAGGETLPRSRADAGHGRTHALTVAQSLHRLLRPARALAELRMPCQINHP